VSRVDRSVPMSPEEVEAELVKALKERDELEAQCAAMRAEVVRLSDAYEGLAAARSKPKPSRRWRRWRQGTGRTAKRRPPRSAR
jgi:uncharacterized protein YukE